MYTERRRSAAIQALHVCSANNKPVHTCTSECGTQLKGCTLGYNKPIKETKNTPGFTNGAVEAYMLSSICNTRPPRNIIPPTIITEIYDGGSPFDNFLNILDGSSPTIDNPAIAKAFARIAVSQSLSHPINPCALNILRQTTYHLKKEHPQLTSNITLKYGLASPVPLPVAVFLVYPHNTVHWAV